MSPSHVAEGEATRTLRSSLPVRTPAEITPRNCSTCRLRPLPACSGSSPRKRVRPSSLVCPPSPAPAALEPCREMVLPGTGGKPSNTSQIAFSSLRNSLYLRETRLSCAAAPDSPSAGSNVVTSSYSTCLSNTSVRSIRMSSRLKSCSLAAVLSVDDSVDASALALGSDPTPCQAAQASLRCSCSCGSSLRSGSNFPACSACAALWIAAIQSFRSCAVSQRSWYCRSHVASSSSTGESCDAMTRWQKWRSMTPLGLRPGCVVYVSVSWSTSSNQRVFHAVFFWPAFSIQPPITLTCGRFGLKWLARRAASAAELSMPIASDMRRRTLPTLARGDAIASEPGRCQPAAHSASPVSC